MFTTFIEFAEESSEVVSFCLSSLKAFSTSLEIIILDNLDSGEAWEA